MPDFKSAPAGIQTGFSYSTSPYPSGPGPAQTSQLASATTSAPATHTAAAYGGRFQLGDSMGSLQTSLYSERSSYRASDFFYPGDVQSVNQGSGKYLGKCLDVAMREAVEKGDVQSIHAMREQHQAEFSSHLSSLVSIGMTGFFAVESERRTLLMLAAVRGDQPMVDCLLTLGANVGQAEGYGRTALMLSAEKGCQGVVERLLQVEGMDIDQVDRHGASALMYAAVANRTVVVECLLRNGAGDWAGEKDRALDLAIPRQNWRMVSLLLDHGATFNTAINHKRDFSALKEAIYGRSPQFEQDAVSRGAHSESPDEPGPTAFLQAVSTRSSDKSEIWELTDEERARLRAAAEVSENAPQPATPWSFQEFDSMASNAVEQAHEAMRSAEHP